MHKYIPRVHVVVHESSLDVSQIVALPTEGVCTFSFPETQFTTVTAYQNQQVMDYFLNTDFILKTLIFWMTNPCGHKLIQSRAQVKWLAL